MNKIIVDLDILKLVFEQQARKTVGKVCKRFETCNDKEVIKKECKELIYESFRDVIDSLNQGKILFINQNEQKGKE